MLTGLGTVGRVHLLNALLVFRMLVHFGRRLEDSQVACRVSGLTRRRACATEVWRSGRVPVLCLNVNGCLTVALPKLNREPDVARILG